MRAKAGMLSQLLSAIALLVSVAVFAFALVARGLICSENCAPPVERDLQLAVAVVGIAVSATLCVSVQLRRKRSARALALLLLPVYALWALLLGAAT